MQIKNYIFPLVALLLVSCNADKSATESISHSVTVSIPASMGSTTRSQADLDYNPMGGFDMNPTIVVGDSIDSSMASDDPTSTLPQTRTELGDVVAGGTQQEILWSPIIKDASGNITYSGDMIAVWANQVAPEGSTYSFYKPFYFRAYGDNFNEGRFEGTFANTDADPTMPTDGTFTYHALYPYPNQSPTATQRGNNVTVNGTTVKVTIPSEQDGSYNPSLDVMYAATRGSALLPSNTDNISSDYVAPHLHFSHLFHAMRIYIPANKNKSGEGVKRLDITFGWSAVGTVEFDIKSPQTTTWTSASNTISLIFPDDNMFNEGQYLWVFTRPQENIQSSISFQSYNQYGIPSQAISTTLSGVNFGANSITPIALTIPQLKIPSSSVVNLEFTQAGNNLGEELQTLNLKGNGSNYWFVEPFTPNEGKNTAADFLSAKVRPSSTDANGHPIYRVAAVRNSGAGAIDVEYESEHALLTGYSITPNYEGKAKFTVPYLFEENFDGVNKPSHYNDNEGIRFTAVGGGSATDLTSSEYGWPSYSGYSQKWTGARCGIENKSIRVCCRSESAVGVPGTYNGRLDSPNMQNLKSDASNIKLRIEFNYSFGRQGSKTNNYQQHYFAVGTHTTGGAINAATGVGGWWDPPLIGFTISGNVTSEQYLSDFSGSFSNIDKSVYYETTASCSRSTRFVWEVYVNQRSKDGYFNYWLYMDNIRVSIAQ